MTMDAFGDIITAWREASFPPGSDNDQLDEVHADLALFDTWVAAAVLPYLHSLVWEPVVPDVFAALDRLEQSLGELELDAGDRERANSYAAYALLLRRAYSAFLQVGGSG